MDINARAKQLAENTTFGSPLYGFVYKLIVITQIYECLEHDGNPSSLYAYNEETTSFRTMKELQLAEVGLKEQLSNYPVTVTMDNNTYKIFHTYKIIIEQEK